MTRLVSGVLLAAAFVAVVWFGNATVLLVVAMAVGVLAAHEYGQLMPRAGVPVTPWLTWVAVAAVVLVVARRDAELSATLALVVIVSAVVALMTTGASGGDDIADPSARLRSLTLTVVATAFPALYIGLPLGMLVDLQRVAGRESVLVLMGSVAISDTAQYYAGRSLGRHKLAPRISPAKTFEGALGGLVVTPLLLALVGPRFIVGTTAMPMAAIGVVMVAAGIAGDLFESMMKRAAGAKDSSALIPGHGGALDRIDALLFATPVFYLYLRGASL